MLPDKIKEKISETGTDFNENKLESINILKGFKALRLTEGFSEFKHLKRSGYSFHQNIIYSLKV
ncbi:MAG: hypothetical protein BWZ11_01508 [Bacteroidetes bacterium ADurb.BinA395]|nr:MAG: hypothetical protein BWZ11_01508 [Bacteroidetes bacterium ADurb.BinA395]